MSDEPFGRQPEPVYVTLEGDPRDVIYWLGQLSQRGEFKGDAVVIHPGATDKKREFTIYPRAVNE